MPTTKKIQPDDAIGSSTMQTFFRPAGKPGFLGRPKGSGTKKKCPRKGQQHTAAAEDAAVPVPVKSAKAALAVQPAVRPTAKRPKLPRTQWSLPENAALMQECVEDWLEKKGNYNEGMNMEEYCATIPGLKKGTCATIPGLIERVTEHTPDHNEGEVIHNSRVGANCSK